MFVFALLCITCVLSSFAIILKSKRELVALPLLSYGMSCYCKCSVILSHSAMGRSAVYDCGIS